MPALVVLFLGVSMLELAGLGLIAPYITLVMKPEALLEGRLGELLIFIDRPHRPGDPAARIEWTPGSSLSRQGDRGPGHQQCHHPLFTESANTPAYPTDVELSEFTLYGLSSA